MISNSRIARNPRRMKIEGTATLKCDLKELGTFLDEYVCPRLREKAENTLLSYSLPDLRLPPRREETLLPKKASPPLTYDYRHYEKWLPNPDEYFRRIRKTVNFTQGKVVVYGSEKRENRKTSMHVRDLTTGKKYSYSGTTKQVKPFTKEMEEIAVLIEDQFGIRVDMCLCNLYEDGTQNIGWHSDSEKDLSDKDGGPHIFSLSLGATRKFRIKRKDRSSGWDEEMILRAGDLVHMKGNCQKLYKHSVPAEKRVGGPRINLTFRVSA